MLELVRWVHLVAAATWTGGLLVLAALVVALRRANAPREYLVVAARQFGRVSWTAMVIAIITGIAQVEIMHMPWAYGRLHMKLGLVGLSVIVAGIHQLTARKSSPAVRGILQLVIMLLALGIFGAAVML